MSGLSSSPTPPLSPSERPMSSPSPHSYPIRPTLKNKEPLMLSLLQDLSEDFSDKSDFSGQSSESEEELNFVPSRKRKKGNETAEARNATRKGKEKLLRTSFEPQEERVSVQEGEGMTDNKLYVVQQYEALEKIFKETNNLEEIKDNDNIIEKILKITSRRCKTLSSKKLQLLPKAVQEKYKRFNKKMEIDKSDEFENLCKEISKNRKDYIERIVQSNVSNYNRFKKAYLLGLVPNINPDDIQVFHAIKRYEFFNQQNIIIRLLLLDDNADILGKTFSQYHNLTKQDMKKNNFIKIYERSSQDKKYPLQSLDYTSYYSFYNQPKKIQDSFLMDGGSVDGSVYGKFFKETDEKKKEFTNNDGSINTKAYDKYNPKIFIKRTREYKTRQQQEEKLLQKQQQKEERLQKQKEEQEKSVLEAVFIKELLNVQAEFMTKEGINYNDYKEYKEKRDEDAKQKKFINFLGFKIKEYYEDIKKRGFKTVNNKVDVKTHNQFLQEDAQTQGNYTNTDGTVNVEAYKARNALFGE